MPQVSKLIGQKSEQIQVAWQTWPHKWVVSSNVSFLWALCYMGFTACRQLWVFSDDFMSAQDKYMRKWFESGYPVLQTFIISISCEGLFTMSLRWFFELLLLHVGNEDRCSWLLAEEGKGFLLHHKVTVKLRWHCPQ